MEEILAGKRYLGYFTMVLICFILGFALTLQIKSVYKIKNDTIDTDTARADQLQKTLTEEKKQNEALSQQVSDLKKTVNDYRTQTAKTGDATKAINDQLTKAEIMAGLKSVQGKGVTVTMDDSKQTLKSGQDASAFVIHDTDILQVLNELRDAGAEAISINGERVLATTEVRCAGTVVSVNNTRYAAPFTINAIGDPDKLKSALLMKNGIVDQLSQWGIEINVETKNDILVNAYSGTPQMKFAKPSSKGGD